MTGALAKRTPLTDEDLTQQFGVSRFTVRAALDVLVADGVIKRYRRRGTFVIARPQGAGTWMLTSLDDLVLSSFPTRPLVLDAIYVEMPGACRRRPRPGDEARALRIRVMRTAEGEPYAHSIIHIPCPLARHLPSDWQERLATEPFVSLVAGANTLVVHKAIQVAQALAAPRPIAAMLDLAVGSRCCCWSALSSTSRRHPAGARASLLPPRSLPADHRIPQHHHRNHNGGSMIRFILLLCVLALGPTLARGAEQAVVEAARREGALAIADRRRAKISRSSWRRSRPNILSSMSPRGSILVRRGACWRE